MAPPCIDLLRQPLQNGKHWVHEPVRLSVMIDASRALVETIKAHHESVRQLIDSHWLHRFRLKVKLLNTIRAAMDFPVKAPAKQGKSLSTLRAMGKLWLQLDQISY